MGVAVYYRTTAPVDAATRAALEQAADAGHPWWCEGLGFYGVDDERAGGSSKLFRLTAWTRDGTVEEVDPGEDTLMAWNDCRLIIAELAALSRQHGMTWKIEIEGELLGYVTPAGADDALEDAMWHFRESAGLGIGESEAPAVVARIRDRYLPEG